MSFRRLADRRRRVIYSHEQTEHAPTRTPREAQQLREARRPPAAYGVRVQRRLEAKWYSLVPVRRKSLSLTITIFAAITLILIGLHVASVAVPVIAERPNLAKGLRLDQAESIGTWWRSILSLLAAGCALLIYQLRRYRLDDYSGQYRLWRAVFWGTIFISLESTAGIISLSGAWVEFLFGSRIGLSGSDWVRMLVAVALFLYGIRVIIDVRACRVSVAAFVTAGLFASVPETVRWNLWQIETLPQWCFVMSASLVSATAGVIGLVSYLRYVYREVNEIEDSGPWINFATLPHLRLAQQWSERRAQRKEELHRRREEAEQKKAEKQKAREEGIAKRAAAKQKAREESESQKEAAKKEREEAAELKRQQQEELRESRRQQKAAARAERKAAAAHTTTETEPHPSTEDVDPADESMDAKPKQKRGLGGWLKRKQPDAESAEDQTRNDPDPNQESDIDAEGPPSAARKQRKLSLGGFFGRKKTATDEEDHSTDDSDIESQLSSEGDPNDSANHTETNADDIDWNSLSKAERRRMRKQMKRNRAA